MNYITSLNFQVHVHCCIHAINSAEVLHVYYALGKFSFLGYRTCVCNVDEGDLLFCLPYTKPKPP